MSRTRFHFSRIAATALWLGAVATGVCQRPDLPEVDPLTRDDRILVLAPHEDDEALGAGGFIQRARSTHAAVRVVYLTYGDHNEWAFMVYRRRPWLTPSINRGMGELRRAEAVEASAHLGLTERDLVFLGYPDNGMLTIWKQHWDKAPPMHSLLTNTRRVPYKDAFSYGKPYKGEEIVADIQRQILDFHPTRILVTHPLDSNPDHRAYYLFLQVALLNLADQIPAPLVLTYPIHFGPWPRPLRYHPDSWLPLPRTLAEEPAPDWMFLLTPEEVQRKYEAICLYKTQIADRKSWLISFARANELFSSPRPVALQTETPTLQSSWTSTSPVYPTPDTEAYEQESSTNHLHGVAFRQSRDGLLIQIGLRRTVVEDMGVSVYAFGSRADRPFGTMPKLNIEWEEGSVVVRDQTTPVRQSGVRAEVSGKQVTFLLPWSTLGLPDAVFVQVQGLMREIPISQTGWQVLTRAPFTTSRSKP